MMKLTKMEIMVLNGMRDNEYNDAIEHATWTFTAIDNSGLNAKQARGVIASLVKKGLVIATKGSHGDEDMIGFTQEGVKLFENADGAECQWGGPKLLKQLEEGFQEAAEAPEMDENDLIQMTVKELAALTGMNEKAIRRKLRKAGMKREGKIWMISKNDLPK